MAGQCRRDFLRTAGLGAAALLSGGPSWPQAQRRPNVLFILIDDMGWLDSGIYGSRYYETPNVDRLAQRSMLFTNAYSANPFCSPTRASILTGQFPARLGITVPAGHLPPLPEDQPVYQQKAMPFQQVLCPESRRHLKLEERTIAEAFREAGYRTGFIGKWHLGQPEEFWPQHQGFEVNIGGGGYPGPPSYFSPYRIRPLPDGPEGEYIADRLTDETLSYLEQHRHEEFMLFLWHYSIHAPYQAKEELIAKYQDRTDPRGLQDNPIMAGMIHSMDESIGRILDKLDALGIADETIIVFSSDNGGNEYDRVGEAEWTPTNNDPLRSGKGSMYEGGVRVPMLVCWPGVVQVGARCDEPVMSVDFYPTLLDMGGLQPQPGQILDGVSLMPVLQQQGGLGREALFCHMPHVVNSKTGLLGQPATWVRKGDWKLIRFYATGEGFPNERELYNLREDIGETRNLAAQMPDKVRELDALIDRFLADTGALLPIRNPNYDPRALPILAGWRPSGECKLMSQDGLMRIESLGGDPFVMTADVPDAQGPMVARFAMRSTSAGIGQFFYADEKTPNFGPTVRLDFGPIHDGQWHEYAVPFQTTGKLKQIRIDPCAATGVVEIDWVRLCDAEGTVLKEWTFAQ